MTVDMTRPADHLYLRPPHMAEIEAWRHEATYIDSIGATHSLYSDPPTGLLVEYRWVEWPRPKAVRE